MPENRQWVLSRHPEGEPVREDFRLEEVPVPDLGPYEVHVRTRYLSVDPGMRPRMREQESYAPGWDPGDPLWASAVGEVVASEHPDWEAGDVVAGRWRWAEHDAVDGDDLRVVEPPIETALSVLGGTGLTAYFGLFDVAEPRAGDTVVVSGAAGAVGSVAVQLAALSGCRVVGIAGTDEKCVWLEEIGADAAINYRTADDYWDAVGDAAPGGVDVYFDNVGGEITDAVLDHANDHSRVAVCGQISLYNAEEAPEGPRRMYQRTRMRVEGFLVFDYEDRYDEARERLREWMAAGDIEYRHTVAEGLERAPDAFLGLFEGANIGKQLVGVAQAARTE
jgi:NADPH-dependent curcumin reductase CurA